MDALILAAGYGSRLNPLFPSKPLATIHGVTLIEIAIRQLATAGASRVCVATGYNASEVEIELARISARAELEILSRRVSDWSKPNGFSVIAGSEPLSDTFLLVMGDHILSSRILCELARSHEDDRDVTLGIDRRINSPLIDPDDATWVKRHENGFIERIGKQMKNRCAVDCGAFLATSALPEAIAEAIAEGASGSLSDGMQVIADRGRAATHDIGDAWWIDVDDPKAHALAELQIAEHIDIHTHPISAKERNPAGIAASLP